MRRVMLSIVAAAVLLSGAACAPTIQERFDMLALRAQARCEADGGIYSVQSQTWGRARNGLQFGLCSR